nr:hypothetical protein [Spirochaetota bacterium]
MEKYIELVLNRPKTVLAILLLVTIALGSGIPKLRFDTSVDVMMPQHDEQYLYNEEVKKVYGNNGKLIVMNLSAPNLWSREFFQNVDRLTDDIEEYRTFDEEKENGRLEKFRALSRVPGASRETLLAGFQDDPVYRRALEREMDGLPLRGSRARLGRASPRQLCARRSAPWLAGQHLSYRTISFRMGLLTSLSTRLRMRRARLI